MTQENAELFLFLVQRQFLFCLASRKSINKYVVNVYTVYIKLELFCGCCVVIAH